MLDEAEERTRRHTGLHVNLAVGYGGRNEIVDAVRSIVAQHAGRRRHAGGARRAPHPRDDRRAPLHRWPAGSRPRDPHLGEQRLSDFLLWQSAHSEFYFVEALGPDLRQVDFLRAIRDFADRDRRFGR